MDPEIVKKQIIGHNWVDSVEQSRYKLRGPFYVVVPVEFKTPWQAAQIYGRKMIWFFRLFRLLLLFGLITWPDLPLPSAWILFCGVGRLAYYFVVWEVLEEILNDVKQGQQAVVGWFNCVFFKWVWRQSCSFMLSIWVLLLHIRDVELNIAVGNASIACILVILTEGNHWVNEVLATTEHESIFEEQGIIVVQNS